MQEASSIPRNDMKSVLRSMLPLLVFSLAWLWLAHQAPLVGWLDGDGPAARWVKQLGPAGVFAFLVVMVPCLVAGMPRLLFCPLAGALFGFWPGLALNIAGPLASHYAVFRFVRWRSNKSRERAVRLPTLGFLGQEPDLPVVLLAQLAPLPGLVSTIGLAWSSVRDGAYLTGSALAFVPQAVPLILLGSGSLQRAASHPARMAAAAAISGLGAWVLLRYARRRGAKASATMRSTPVQA